jgi:acyl-coenzyme A thioesterase PaaI-like protein
MARMLDGMEQLLRGEVPPPAAATRIGMRLASFTPGEAVVELDADASHANPMGTVHGESYTTLEIKTNFLRPVRTGRLSARARVRNAGRTVGLVECDVLTADGKVAAYAVSTCMTLRGEAAQGR